jgi:hypothetical protein
VNVCLFIIDSIEYSGPVKTTSEKVEEHVRCRS